LNWLLLKGIKMDSRHFGDFPERYMAPAGLEQAFPMDLPGTGTKSGGKAPANVPALARDLRARWLALRNAHPGPWSILGMSLGGMVALSWASQFPDDFASAVVGNSSAGDLSKPHLRFSLGNFPPLARSMVVRDKIQREVLVLDRITNHLGERAKKVGAEYARYQDSAPIHGWVLARQLLAAATFSAPDVQCPVLILSGLGDVFVDPSCSIALAERYDAPLHTHPTAGHNLTLDAPEWLTDQLVQWTARVGATTSRVRRRK